MTRNNLLVLIIFLFNSSTKTLEVDYTDNVSQELIVSHYDCTKMQDNRMYSLNKVAECNISPKNLYIAAATITLYQKNYRTDLSATMCSFKVHVFRYNCGMFSHTSYVHDQNSITYDMIVRPEMCRLASKSKKKSKSQHLMKILMFPLNLIQKHNQISMMAKLLAQQLNVLTAKKKHYTFETLMQLVNLTYNYGTKEVSNRDRKKLPCLLMEGGCETTTLDSFAYTWDTPKNCVMTKNLTQDAKMLHYPLTMDQKENQFFFLSEFNDTGKGKNIKQKVFLESYELCGKPERLYKTNFESLFVNYQGGFAMPGGELRTKEYIKGTHISFRLTTLARSLIRL